MNDPQSEALTEEDCPHCTGANPRNSRFCKTCGAALKPPPACPACDASLPNDARFCAGCGLRLLGPRSEVSEIKASTVTAKASPLSNDLPPQTPTSKASVESELAGHSDDGKDSLRAGQTAEKDAVALLNAAQKKRRSSQGVGLGTNALFFVSVLIAFVVGMYAWNKDQPKMASMFSGAPTPQNTPDAPGPNGVNNSAASFSGRIVIADKLAAQVDTRGVLYVSVRNVGMPNQGPPLAAKRFSQPSFPLSYSISNADVMMKGLPFTGPFDVYVRLDRDGDAMTKGPDDLIADGPKANVKAGDRDVNITLSRRIKDKMPLPKTSVLNPSKPSVGENSASVQGVIQIARSLNDGSDRSIGTIYLIVRPSGMPPRGPPLAVRKYERPVFPLSFEIGPEHVMMKQMPFLGPFDIYVRWDQDGNAMSKQTGDLSSKEPAKNVSKGANKVVLLLNERRQ